MGSLNDKGVNTIGGAKPKAGSKGQGIKLLVALVIFGAAGVVFAMYQGWISNPLASKPEAAPVITPEEKAAFDKQAEKVKADQKAGKVQIGGS